MIQMLEEEFLMPVLILKILIAIAIACAEAKGSLIESCERRRQSKKKAMHELFYLPLLAHHGI